MGNTALLRPFHQRLLIVDDDAAFCEVSQLLFGSESYEVRCAEDGFEALALMKSVLPDVIVCDLNMPRMSGFEFLSVVRRRFPQIPVVALSGTYGSQWPTGLIADAFFQKGGNHSPVELVEKIKELLDRAPLRANVVKTDHAPVWVPVNSKPYFVLTCTNCLRSFSVPAQNESRGKGTEQKTKCEFCDTEVSFIVDASVA